MTRKRGETVAGGYRSEPPPLRRAGMRPVTERYVRLLALHRLNAERKASRDDLLSGVRELRESCDDWLAADEATHKPIGLEQS